MKDRGLNYDELGKDKPVTHRLEHWPPVWESLPVVFVHANEVNPVSLNPLNEYGWIFTLTTPVTRIHKMALFPGPRHRDEKPADFKVIDVWRLRVGHRPVSRG